SAAPPGAPYPTTSPGSAAWRHLPRRRRRPPPPSPRSPRDEADRPPHPHDEPDHGRLRAHGPGGHRRPHRARLLAGTAPHPRRQLRGLLLVVARLGALSGEPVRHPALLHHRPQPEGGEHRSPGGRRDGALAPLPREGG